MPEVDRSSGTSIYIDPHRAQTKAFHAFGDRRDHPYDVFRRVVFEYPDAYAESHPILHPYNQTIQQRQVEVGGERRHEDSGLHLPA